jgi:hypothetical protein
MPPPKDPIKYELWRQRNSASHIGLAMGEKNPMFGKPGTMTGKKFSDEHKRRIGDAQRGKKHHHFGKPANNKGIPMSEQQKIKLSESRKQLFINHPELREKMRGENNPLWKGGIAFQPYCPKFNSEFKEQVRNFFNNCCIECGTPQNGKKLHVHHVNFNKMSCCNGTPPLFVPLCTSCHGRTQKDRPKWERHFTEMITMYYQGKCYFTKEEMANV